MKLSFWRRSEINAAQYLRSEGYRIIASGFRVREGEVDLIAWDGDILCFVEVKSRQNADAPEDAVGFNKRRRVIRAARAYISRYKLHDRIFRFDVVSVNALPDRTPEYRLLRDAFH